MSQLRRACLGLYSCLPLLVLVAGASAQDPVLSVRPAPAPDSAPGRIRLDVVVTGRQGTPVPDLKKEDFTLTDNKQPRKIVDFELVDGSGAKAGQPAEVILLIDTVNATFQQVAVAREQIAKFLRQNGGHLNRVLAHLGYLLRHLCRLLNSHQLSG